MGEEVQSFKLEGKFPLPGGGEPDVNTDGYHKVRVEEEPSKEA